MIRKSRYIISIYFTMLFMVLIVAPTILITFDDSTDVSIFYGISEEEENENSNFVFENSIQASEILFEAPTNDSRVGYYFKNYSKPILSLILSPPEFVS